jgi:hypothetical protein
VLFEPSIICALGFIQIASAKSAVKIKVWGLIAADSEAPFAINRVDG